MAKMSTQRLTVEVCRLIERVGDPVLLRLNGEDTGADMIFVNGENKGLVIQFVGRATHTIRAIDYRIRKSTVRFLRAIDRLNNSIDTSESVTTEEATGLAADFEREGYATWIEWSQYEANYSLLRISRRSRRTRGEDRSTVALRESNTLSYLISSLAMLSNILLGAAEIKGSRPVTKMKRQTTASQRSET